MHLIPSSRREGGRLDRRIDSPSKHKIAPDAASNAPQVLLDVLKVIWRSKSDAVKVSQAVGIPSSSPKSLHKVVSMVCEEKTGKRICRKPIACSETGVS
jgi:hypothetical protein